MKPGDILGRTCYVRRVDSEGNGKAATVDRVEPQLPFPIHASWKGGGAWFLPIELEPSSLAIR